jgi:hypothetical protein
MWYENECPFIHENIGILYGVEPMPIDQLPTTCGCGAPLTYTDMVVFVTGEFLPEEYEDENIKVEKMKLK